MRKLVTIKTSTLALRDLRTICGLTEEKQYEVLERLLNNEKDMLLRREEKKIRPRTEKNRQSY